MGACSYRSPSKLAADVGLAAGHESPAASGFTTARAGPQERPLMVKAGRWNLDVRRGDPWLTAAGAVVYCGMRFDSPQEEPSMSFDCRAL